MKLFALKTFLIDNKLSEEELASLIEMTPEDVHQVIDGKSLLSQDALNRLYESDKFKDGDLEKYENEYPDDITRHYINDVHGDCNGFNNQNGVNSATLDSIMNTVLQTLREDQAHLQSVFDYLKTENGKLTTSNEKLSNEISKLQKWLIEAGINPFTGKKLK